MRASILVVLAAVVAAGCDVRVGDGFSFDVTRGIARDEWTRTYTLPSSGTLEVINVNGTIEALPASGADVDVRAEREARAPNDEAARALLGAIEMREEVSGDRVRIEARADTGFSGRHGLRVRYTVRVPAGLSVSFETENGGVRLDGLDGRVTASTMNGGITGERLSGAVSAESVNGGVRLGFSGVNGEVRATTTNGGIRLELPAAAGATLDAECVNGRVDVSEALRLEASEERRCRVRGRLNGGGPRIVAETVNGGVSIRGLSVTE